VTETVVNQFSYPAFDCCLVQGMEVYLCSYPHSLLVTCDRKLGDTKE
jgi:hypothetical protein